MTAGSADLSGAAPRLGAVTPATDTWTPADMPDQAGRTALVTGPTLGGLGFHTALELARRGAAVVLAGRSPEKLAEARNGILAEHPGASVELVRLDLASLTSVREAAAVIAGLGPLGLLVNNAGIMAPPYSRTLDGLELQLATNHFGPFLLTGLLLPQLVASGDARVVTVSSLMHKYARKAPLGDPRQESGRYSAWQVYGETKLANLLFSFELERRLREAELPVKALASHPGIASTHLVANGPLSRLPGRSTVGQLVTRTVSQSPAQGAWPTLMAATADLPGGTLTGPSGRLELTGAAKVVESRRLAHDRDAQRRLWEISEQVTGISYP